VEWNCRLPLSTAMVRVAVHCSCLSVCLPYLLLVLPRLPALFRLAHRLIDRIAVAVEVANQQHVESLQREQNKRARIIIKGASSKPVLCVHGIRTRGLIYPHLCVTTFYPHRSVQNGPPSFRSDSPLRDLPVSGWEHTCKTKITNDVGGVPSPMKPPLKSVIHVFVYLLRLHTHG
jgi:hypothetical protein